jgi:hypothetical protein
MTEQEFRRRVAEAYGNELSSPSALRAAAAAALAASRDARPGTRRHVPRFAVVPAIVFAALVVSTMVAAGALHRVVTEGSSTTRSVPPKSQVLTSESVSWAQAQADSPDPLLVPGWLPFNSYHPSQVQEITGPDGRATETITEYRSRDGLWVLIQQNHQHAFNVKVPGPSKPGTIGDQPATFYEFVDGTPTAVIWQLLDGKYVDIIASGLTAAELTQVAATLHT